MQWQLQWRGMGSKLEKGIEGEKKKDLEYRSQSLGTKSVSHRPIFLIFFFLFFFFFLLVCTGLKHLYWPKQLDFAGTTGIFPVQNKGCTCTGALASTVYTSRIGWYGTNMTSLIETSCFISLYHCFTWFSYFCLIFLKTFNM